MHGMVTATDASKEIGCSVATVTRWAKRLALGERYGYAICLTKDDIEKIAKEWKKAAGNPNFSKPKVVKKKPKKKE